MIDEAAGDDSAAIRNYRKVVEAEPDNVVALNNLAYLLSNRSEDLDIALKFAQRAKELARNDGITDDTLGWVLCRKQLYRQAVPYLEHAVAKRPNAKVRYHLAIAYARSGDAGRAKATLSSALAVDPTLEEAKVAREALKEARAGSN
jgi:Tfp pilus assembly protein PilF